MQVKPLPLSLILPSLYSFLGYVETRTRYSQTAVETSSGATIVHRSLTVRTNKFALECIGMQRQQLNGNKKAGWLAGWLLTAGMGSQPNNFFLMLHVHSRGAVLDENVERRQ